MSLRRGAGAVRSASLAAVVVVAVVALTALVACSIRIRTKDAAEEEGPGSGRSVCVLMFDGLPATSFQRLLDAGSLPNLKAAVVDRALRVETAVASLPTETYPNVSAMVTGLFPGHHGIPANVWLDRRIRQREQHTNIFRAYSSSDFLAPGIRTLFERVPGATVCISTPIFRGATVVQKNVTALVASYLRNDWDFLNRKTLDDVGDAYAGGWDAGKVPSLVWAHFLGPDEVEHFDGVDSEALRQNVEAFDRAFGRLLRRLKKRGIAERILFTVVSDHGHTPYAHTVDAEELVHRALFAHPTETDCIEAKCVLSAVPGEKKRDYDVGEAEIAVGAYRGAMIWLPSSRPPGRSFPTSRSSSPSSSTRPDPPTSTSPLPMGGASPRGAPEATGRSRAATSSSRSSSPARGSSPGGSAWLGPST